MDERAKKISRQHEPALAPADTSGATGMSFSARKKTVSTLLYR